MQEEKFLNIIKDICREEELSFDNIKDGLIWLENSSSKGVFDTEVWCTSDVQNFIYRVFETNIFTISQGIKLFYIYSNFLDATIISKDKIVPINFNHCLLRLIDKQLKEMSCELLAHYTFGKLNKVHKLKYVEGITNKQLLDLFKLLFKNYFKHNRPPENEEIISVIRRFTLKYFTTNEEKMYVLNEYQYISLTLKDVKTKAKDYLKSYIDVKEICPQKIEKQLQKAKEKIKNKGDKKMNNVEVKNVALNYNGQVVVKRNDGTYVRYNNETKQLENYRTYVIENNKYIFIFPTNKLNVDDIFVNNEEFFHVLNVGETNIEVINLTTGAHQSIVKETTYNMEMYKKIVTVFDNNAINPMTFLLMKDKEIDPLVFMMLNNNGNNINPLMYMMLNDKNIDPMTLMILMTNNHMQINPLMLMALKNDEKLDKNMLMMLALNNNGMNINSTVN